MGDYPFNQRKKIQNCRWNCLRFELNKTHRGRLTNNFLGGEGAQEGETKRGGIEWGEAMDEVRSGQMSTSPSWSSPGQCPPNTLLPRPISLSLSISSCQIMSRNPAFLLCPHINSLSPKTKIYPTIYITLQLCVCIYIYVYVSSNLYTQHLDLLGIIRRKKRSLLIRIIWWYIELKSRAILLIGPFFLVRSLCNMLGAN